MDAREVVDGPGELRRRLKAIIRNKSRGAPCTFGFEFCGGDDGGRHIGAAAEALREEEDVDVATGRNG